MNPLPANNKQIHLDDRDKLQEGAQTPEARPLFKDHGGNALIKFQRWVRITPYLHRADGHEQAGNSDLQLRVESMSHATLGQNTLQSTQHTTHAKPRLPCNHVPIIMPAKNGMGQQQLNHEKGDLQKKKSGRIFWRAAACESSCAYAANA